MSTFRGPLHFSLDLFFLTTHHDRIIFLYNKERVSIVHVTSLRKVGGSVMLTVPPVLLESLDLSAGSRVGIAVGAGHLIIEPNPRPYYKLEDLLALCDEAAGFSEEEREWLDAPTSGRELI